MKFPHVLKKREGRFFYTYYFNKQGLLYRVIVKEKGRFFKRNYGFYQFSYQEKLLNQQESYVHGVGITESILYFYDEQKRLIEKHYLNQHQQLRYQVYLHYQEFNSQWPFKLSVVRMEKFPFFETKNLAWIKEFLSITGKDFEGSFFLLDLIEKLGSFQ